MQLTDVPRKVFADGKTEFRPGFLDIFHIMDTTPQSDTLDAHAIDRLYWESFWYKPLVN